MRGRTSNKNNRGSVSKVLASLQRDETKPNRTKLNRRNLSTVAEESKTVIVTGGSGGIGGGICRRLGQDWNVVVHYHSNDEAANETVEELKNAGTSAIAVKANLSNEKDVAVLFKQAIDKFGSIDAVVANAGVSGFGAIEETSLEDFQKLFDINLVGSFLIIRQAAKTVSEGGRSFSYRLNWASDREKDREFIRLARRASTRCWSRCRTSWATSQKFNQLGAPRRDRTRSLRRQPARTQRVLSRTVAV